MILLSEADVERLIEPGPAIAAAERAFALHAAGGLPPGRVDLRRAAPRFGLLVLAGAVDDAAIVKANLHAHPDGVRRAASLLTLWDLAACAPRALIATTGFNNHRTAAGFAAACRALARPEAATLAVFGAGKIAPATIRYLGAVRALRRVIVVGRDPARAAALVAAVRGWPEFAGVAVETGTPEAAAHAADIIVTVTTSDTPVFPGAAVRPGTHVILGGANRPDAREADDALIGRAIVYADHLDGCLDRAGDLRLPLASGALPPDRLRGELGAPRTAPPPDAIPVFKSIGIATQDVLLAELLLERAAATGLGTPFDPLG